MSSNCCWYCQTETEEILIPCSSEICSFLMCPSCVCRECSCGYTFCRKHEKLVNLDHEGNENCHSVRLWKDERRAIKFNGMTLGN